jgi:hypothetical protein
VISLPLTAGASFIIPACNAMAFVVSALSPVITFTLIPASNMLKHFFYSFLGGS